MELSSKMFRDLLDYISGCHGRVLSADRLSTPTSEIPAAALVMGEFVALCLRISGENVSTTSSLPSVL